MKDFGWLERYQVAEKGEFRHTDWSNPHSGMISGKQGEMHGLKFTLMDAIVRPIGMKITYGLSGGENGGVFPDTDYGYYLLIPWWEMRPEGYLPRPPLRREGSHPTMAFGWLERHQVAEKGEFRHTDWGNPHFGMISSKRGETNGLKCTLMDAIRRPIGMKTTYGLSGGEMGFYPDPDIHTETDHQMLKNLKTPQKNRFMAGTPRDKSVISCRPLL